MKRIFREDGQLLTDPGDIRGEVQGFYKWLLDSRADTLVRVDLNIVRSGPMFDAADQDLLLQPVTTEDIDEALFSINDDKAPGIDGSMLLL